MITLRYGRFGKAYADHECEKVLLDKTKGDIFISASSENIVTAARCLKAEGRIELTLEYRDDDGVVDLEVDKDGRLPHWPKGFCDFNDDWLSRLISSHLKEGT